MDLKVNQGKQKVICDEALRRIEEIHQLSRQYNGKVSGGHQGKLLELMRHHIDEIEELAQAGNQHFLIETGDLLVLCFELLLENKADVNDVLGECFGRYERKLNSLLLRRATLAQD
ncbi:MAG: hypothetical protein HQL26_09365 [Candidatus Omnitrophica bacterium]|nr:hypothetical protein [Candidatus Omnitrophota bacterium]